MRENALDRDMNAQYNDGVLVEGAERLSKLDVRVDVEEVLK